MWNSEFRKKIIVEINFFPQGLAEIFPNLKAIRLTGVQLKEIHQSDLKPFEQLKTLSLWDNDLEYLEKDLFLYNLNLVGISLEYNKISYIDPNVFDNLKSLIDLHLKNNICISEKAVNSTGVTKIIQKIGYQCSIFEYFTMLVKEKFQQNKNETSRVESLVLNLDQKMNNRHQETAEQMNEKLQQNKNEITKVESLVQKINHEFKNFESTNNTKELTSNSKLKTIFVFIGIPIIVLVTLLNIALVIVCFQKKLTVQLDDSV